eukprot:1580774-Prymnesium_polylepis.3
MNALVAVLCWAAEARAAPGLFRVCGVMEGVEALTVDRACCVVRLCDVGPWRLGVVAVLGQRHGQASAYSD